MRFCEALLLVPKNHRPPTAEGRLRIAPHGWARGGQHTLPPLPLPILSVVLRRIKFPEKAARLPGMLEMFFWAAGLLEIHPAVLTLGML